MLEKIIQDFGLDYLKWLEVDVCGIEVMELSVKNYNAKKVLYFEGYDTYLKFTGHYNSYSKYDWDYPTLVQPKQKLITIFETI